MKKGYVSEIYPTIQGEGLCLGERQVFVRLAGCPLRCQWCDTVLSLSTSGYPLMSTGEILQEIKKVGRRSIKTVSVTGGEPLVQVDFLSELLPCLKKDRRQVYLETAGVHPKALERVIRYCDIISMDIKLPSAMGRSYWKEHAEFLRVAGKKAFVKIILTRLSKESELKVAFRLVAARSRKISVVLQPVTPIAPLAKRLRGKGSLAEDSIRPPTPDQLSGWLALAKKSHLDVRIIPQMHPIWGIQ
jgi:organic radical activating enzyme